MQALVYKSQKFCSFESFSDPKVLENEALVKLYSVGICGSDMHAYLGHDERRLPPLILGHEAAGVVLTGKYKNKRVTINPLVVCGKCLFCQQKQENLCTQRSIISMNPRQGAFAEYLSINEENLFPISDNLSFSKGSLAEPLSCGYRAIKRALEKKDVTQSQILIIGGGAIGVAVALNSRFLGAKKIFIIEPNLKRRKELAKLGDFIFLELEDTKHYSKMDIVVDAFGGEKTRAMASEYAKNGGIISHIGLAEASGGLNIRKMTLQEIDFVGVYTYTRKDFEDTLCAMEKGLLGDLNWFEEYPLHQGQEIFTKLLKGEIAKPKAILCN